MSKMGETKKKIMDSLKVKSKTLTDLSAELNLAPSTVSEHIHELLQMGAIQEMDDYPRKWKYYVLNPHFTAQQYQYQTSIIRRYGFVVPIVITALVGIALLLTSSPQSFACVPEPGYTCGTVSSQSSGALSLTIGNLNKTIQIQGVACSSGASPPPQSAFTPISASLAKGSSTTLNFTCPESQQATPSGTPIHIWVSYNNNGVTASVEVASVSPSATTTVPVTTQSTSIAQYTTTIAPVVSYYYYGTYYGERVSMTLTSYSNLSTIPDLQIYGSISNFQTDDPEYSCLNGQTLDVYEAPNEFPGSFLIYTNPSESWCALGAWLVPQSSFASSTSITTTTVPSTVTITIQPISVTTIPIGYCNTLITVYVGGSVSCNSYTLRLNSLTPVSTGGESWANITMTYANAQFSINTLVRPGYTVPFNVSGSLMDVYLNNTSSGAQQWARLELIPQSITTVPPSVIPTGNFTAVATTAPVQPAVTNDCNLLTTLYLGQSLVCDNYNVTFENFGKQTNAEGEYPAGFDVYFEGSFVAAPLIYPGQADNYSVQGFPLRIYVNQTVDVTGDYWARTMVSS